jgi:CubicO group peptidase (beta-lactamase class C family)
MPSISNRLFRKSILSILVGIAIDQEKIRLKQPISEVLREEIPGSPTIEDLLTMQGGYPESYPRILWISRFSHHPVKALLGTRMAGERFEPVYSTIGADILGYCVSSSTGKSLLRFGNESLFGPFGIRIWMWAVDKLG